VLQQQRDEQATDAAVPVQVRNQSTDGTMAAANSSRPTAISALWLRAARSPSSASGGSRGGSGAGTNARTSSPATWLCS